MNCPNCTNRFKSSLSACPKCGRQNSVAITGSKPKKRGVVKKVLIGIGIVFAALIALGAIGAAIGNNGSNSVAAPEKLGMKTLDFTFAFDGKISNRDAGKLLGLANATTYYYEIDFVNNGHEKYHLAPYSFKLVTNTNGVYSAFTNPLSGKTELQFVELDHDQHGRGQIAFTIPPTETPSQLEYSDGSITIKKPLV